MEYTKRFNFLTEEMKTEVLKQVDRVINRELEGIDIDAFPGSIIVDYLRQKYKVYVVDGDINASKSDIWFLFIIDRIKFYLLGSIYGGEVRFRISDEYLNKEDEE